MLQIMKFTNLVFVMGLLSLTKAEKGALKVAFKEVMFDYERVYKKHTEAEV